MRMTIHNGRAGKDGAYSPKHNDRNFDISSAEHIDPERMPGNVYWNWTGENVSFEDAEKAFYEKHIREHLDAQNARYEAQRHPERVRTMDEYRSNPRTCPEETILMIGHKGDSIPPNTLRAICNDLKNWEENSIPGLTVLDMALHVDEDGAPHIHMRKAWIYRDENNIESISQSKALEGAGIPLPHPDKPTGRHNNRKQTFSTMERQAMYEICRGYGLASLIETKPRERSKAGQTMIEYQARQAEERAKAAEMRAKAAEQKALQMEQERDAARAERERIRGALTHAHARAEKAEKQVREQQEQNRHLKAVESQIRDDMERQQRIARQLADMNKKTRQELKQVKEKLEVYKPYLTRAEQQELEELYRQDELERD